LASQLSAAAWALSADWLPCPASTTNGAKCWTNPMACDTPADKSTLDLRRLSLRRAGVAKGVQATGSPKNPANSIVMAQGVSLASQLANCCG